jgi:hypothetical protein
MARRVPFPPSSIPAYIEQSMKLFVCLPGYNQFLRLLDSGAARLGEAAGAAGAAGAAEAAGGWGSFHSKTVQVPLDFLGY